MTKNGCQKVWRMKIKKFLGKRSNWGNFPRSPKNLSEIGGKSETGGNASLPQGDGRPCLRGRSPGEITGEFTWGKSLGGNHLDPILGYFLKYTLIFLFMKVTTFVESVLISYFCTL